MIDGAAGLVAYVNEIVGTLVASEIEVPYRLKYTSGFVELETELSPPSSLLPAPDIIIYPNGCYH